MRFLLALAVVPILAAAAPAADPRTPQPIPTDEQDLVLFEAMRPARIRVHLQVEGKSFQAHWDAIVAQLFEFLDVNGDGRLSRQEAEHAPSELQLRQMILGNVDVEADEAPKFEQLTDDPKGATLAQLKGYYHRVGVAPWQVDWVARGRNPDHLDDALFKQFNPASLEELTRDSLRKATLITRKFDADHDELVTALELSATGYSGGFVGKAPFRSKSGPFFLLDPSDKGRVLLAKAIIEQYDGDKNGKLSRGEIKLDAGQFRKLDQSRDDALDANELAPWPDEPADLAILLRLDGEAGNSLFVVPDEGGKPRRLDSSIKLVRLGAAQLRSGDQTVEIMRMDGLQARQQRLQSMQLGQFTSLDANRDEALDSKEVYQPPFAMVALLRLADRDGDGKLKKKEFEAFLELQKKTVTRCIIMTFIERGRCLFDFLDADHDHRLSRRELASAAERLAPWMDAKRDSLERSRIPAQYQIVVSQSPLPTFDSDVGAVSAGRPESRLRGPLWFRKMDRNADGDVSAAEFLGPIEQFRKLDLDGDGLIGLPEAETAGRK